VFHVKHEGWVEEARALGVDLPAGADERLDRYGELLIERGAPMRIVAPGDLPRLRERHLLDCLRAAPLVADAESAYDLGSGGGLPGVVIAIARPDLEITLVDVRRNRAAFLDMVVSELSLEHVSVYPRRAETLKARVGLCLARAFKPAATAWAMAEPLLDHDAGRLIYWAGDTFDPASDRPSGASVELFHTPALARSGPLAIMTRQ
jgi:16S rRNA (guanine(527)-N(7))-methyltransferase RsmG